MRQQNKHLVFKTHAYTNFYEKASLSAENNKHPQSQCRDPHPQTGMSQGNSLIRYGLQSGVQVKTDSKSDSKIAFHEY